MWNFIKSVYFRIRNFVAITFTSVVGKSMTMAGKAATYKDSKLKSVLMSIASFAVFCAAYIGLQVFVSVVALLVYLPLFFVVGEVLATLIAIVAVVFFVFDLVNTISFFQKLERALRFNF